MDGDVGRDTEKQAEKPAEKPLGKPLRLTRLGWLQLVAWFCVGGLAAGWVRRLGTSNSATSDFEQDRIDDSIPRVDLSLQDVVREQIESMRSAVGDPDKLVTCYSLASPNNRQQTGPFDHFLRLVSSEPYRQIGLCRDYEIGTAIVNGRVARVLASFLGEGGQGFAFQFVLVKQTIAPYQDCWMTDMVVWLHPRVIGETLGESQQGTTIKGVDL